MPGKTIETKAPGNIFLLGEHSVIYNKKSLLTSLGKYTKVKGKKRNNEEIKVSSKGYGEIDTSFKELEELEFQTHEDYEEEMDPIKDLLSKYYKEKELTNGLEIEVESEIPKKSGGMSSSTAVLSSVLRLLNKLNGEKMNGDQYFDFLLPIQVKIHGGAASGSEIMSSSLGGYNIVRKGEKGVEYENLEPRKLHIVVGDTGIEAKTSKTVQYVKKGWENHKKSYEKVFNEIEQLVERGEKTIKENNVEKLGKLMNKNQEKLKTLGVSHPKLEELIKTSIKAGAYGAKLSGGGKGGIMVALTSKEKQKKVARAIESKNGKAITTEIGVKGSIYR